MEQKKGLTGSTLKIIAMVTMLIDHIGASILENGVLKEITNQSVVSADVAALHAYNRWLFVDRILRFTGRLAFPIFCFLLVEGFLHTRDWKKYFVRLLLFSFISEIPFDLAFHKECFYWEGQNVFFTLWIGLLVLVGMKYMEERQEFTEAARYLLQAVVVIAGIVIAECLNTDYGGFGVLVIALMYFLRSNKKAQIVCGCVCFLWEITAPLAFIPISQYNGKRGLDLKYFFYFFYPVHLLILGLLTKMI